MIKVNVLSEEKSWSRKIKKRQELFNKVCKNFPRKLRFHNRKAYLNLLLSNNTRIKELNKRFRNKNKHTDILSFPFEKIKKNSKEIYLGDIIISFNYINKPKNLNTKEFRKKTIKIFIHGFLHLLGYDHIKERDYKKMSDMEQKVYISIEKFLN